MKQTKHEKWLKKLGLKELHINMGTFNFGLNVVIGNIKNINEYVNFKFETKDKDYTTFDNGWSARGLTFGKPRYCPIIWLPKYLETPEEYATVAHESLHVAYDIFSWANLPMTRDTEEVMTHAMSHIIREILRYKKK